jgi:hypothetical protein
MLFIKSGLFAGQNYGFLLFVDSNLHWAMIVFFSFFGVLRLAQTPEPGLKRFFSSKVAKVLEQRNRIINPQYCSPTTRPIALGVKLAPTAGLALPATAVSKSIF